MFRIFLSCIVCALVSGPQNAFSEEDLYEADEIVVTATKTEKKILDVPGTVNVVTSDEIEKTSASVGNTVDEVLTSLPGVHARKGLGSPWSRIFVTLRGTGPQCRTLILVDGQAINEYYYGSTGGANWELVPLESVEKIEVVKGPFSSLYGGNAMGGVINIMTKTPEKRNIKFKTKFGSYGNQFHDVNYSDKFGKFGINIGYNRKETDGYVHEYSIATAKPGGGGIKVTGWDRTKSPTGETVYVFGDNGKSWYCSDSVTGKITYNFSELSKLTLSVVHTDAEREEKGGKSYLKNAAGERVSSGMVEIEDRGVKKTFMVSENNFLGTTYRKPSTLATLSFDHIFDEKKSLSAKLGITDQEWGWTMGTRLPSGMYNLTPSRNIQAEVQTNLHLSETNILTVGLSNRYEELSNEVWMLKNWKERGSKTVWTSKLGGDINTTGLYIQDEIKVAEQLTLFAGLRFDRWSNNGGYFKRPNAPEIKYDDKIKNQLSPKLSLLFKAPKDVMLRSSVGQAFRGPSPSELYRSFTVRTMHHLANPTLSPETITSWEISADRLFGKTTFAQATYFINHMEDLIYPRYYNNTEITSYNATNGTSHKRIWTDDNVGEARSQGIELSLRHKLLSDLTLDTNYTFTDTEIMDNPANPKTENKEFIDTPNHMFNLKLNYSQDKWFASIALHYVSDAYIQDDNTDTTDNVPDGIDPYTIVSLRGSYDVTSWAALDIGINNLFDEVYHHNYEASGRTLYSGLSVEY